MVSIRSIFASIAFFTAFVFAAPTPEADLAKRDAKVIGEIVQYFEHLGGDVRNLTSDFDNLAGKAVNDVASDIQNVIGNIENIFSQNSTIQSILGDLNPANITGDDISQIANAVISIIKDLLNFIPSAANWIIQAKDDAQDEVRKLLTLPHEFIQFVLTLLGQLGGKVPAIGGAIEFFFNLLKQADNQLHQLL